MAGPWLGWRCGWPILAASSVGALDRGAAALLGEATLAQRRAAAWVWGGVCRCADGAAPVGARSEAPTPSPAWLRPTPPNLRPASGSWNGGVLAVSCGDREKSLTGGASLDDGDAVWRRLPLRWFVVVSSLPRPPCPLWVKDQIFDWTASVLSASTFLKVWSWELGGCGRLWVVWCCADDRRVVVRGSAGYYPCLLLWLSRQLLLQVFAILILA
jgi:hypothetical protein